jgi:hypothetical protein
MVKAVVADKAIEAAAGRILADSDAVRKTVFRAARMKPKPVPSRSFPSPTK